MTLIDHRSEKVDQHIVPGHWEDNLIKGAMNRSRVGTLVERTTLFVALVKLDDGVPKPPRGVSPTSSTASKARCLSITYDQTYDQGREMARHQWLEQ